LVWSVTLSAYLTVITYSPSFTLVPTQECFNRCTYCNFRRDRGAAWLSVAEARTILLPLQHQGIVEILILSGEVHPQDPRRPQWFQMLYDLGALALELGFLPHTNCGILTYDEMQSLKTVNASLGLMLENIAPLPVHRLAPSKIPQLRLEQLVWAGELKIAFTTGLLLGIGETQTERVQSLEAIATIQQQYGHIQEVILQPHRRGTQQTFSGTEITPAELQALVLVAREILGPTIALQVPPNLVTDLAGLLQTGVTDLGGISPMDVVNPDYEQPDLAHLQSQLQSWGWQLQPRLPVYPHLWSTVSSLVAAVLYRVLQGNKIT